MYKALAIKVENGKPMYISIRRVTSFMMYNLMYHYAAVKNNTLKQ